MRIKYLLIAFCFTLLCFTTSCNSGFANGKGSEVDFSKEIKINIEHNFEVFDAVIYYQEDCLSFKYCDNCGTISDTEVIISSDEYRIYSNELEFKGSVNELNDSFLPFIIYNVISECNGVLITQAYDEVKDCSYFEESVLSSFFRLEIYENNGESSYTVIVT